MYDLTCIPHFDFTELLKDFIMTRGNRYKLSQPHCHYDLRKYAYTNGVIFIYTVGHKKTHQNVFRHNFRKTRRILNKFGRLLL